MAHWLFASPLRRTWCMAGVPLLLGLAACDSKTPQSLRDLDKAFPMGQAHVSVQPPRETPLFGDASYMRAQDVLPPAKADVREPLPPAVPLPQPDVQQIVQEGAAAQSGSESGAEQGGSSPAAGMAAGITNAQGNSETNKLDAGTAP